MPLHQLRDDNDKVVPVFRRRPDLAHNVEVGAGSAGIVVFDQDTKIVSFWAEGTVYIKFGDASVTADQNDHALPAGVVDYEPLIDANGVKVATHVSIYAETAITFHLSERE